MLGPDRVTVTRALVQHAAAEHTTGRVQRWPIRCSVTATATTTTPPMIGKCRNEQTSRAHLPGRGASPARAGAGQVSPKPSGSGKRSFHGSTMSPSSIVGCTAAIVRLVASASSASTDGCASASRIV